MVMNCTICDRAGDFFQSGRLLDRYQVDYWRCAACGSVGTEPPYWLAAAYDRAITSSDIGLVCRNLEMARLVSAILYHCYPPQAKFLDYGGGYGMFVRLMRDRGYDFYWQDEYCQNLLAAHWSAPPEEHYDLVTAFEVLEHLPQPLTTLEALFQRAPSLLFSTELLPAPAPALGDWDYYGPEHGQHIVFYTTKALEQLAQRYHKHFYSNGRNLHLLSDKPLNFYQQRILRHGRWAKLLGALRRRPSLLPQDYQQAIAIAANLG
jgi:Methyltransferase domain